MLMANNCSDDFLNTGIPDACEDEWIENVEQLEEMIVEYFHLRQRARDVFEMLYQETISIAPAPSELAGD